MKHYNVAVLGTGLMGAPMARNLAAAGFSVTVWNRTRDKATALADVARVAEDPQTAVSKADCVITMVQDAAAVTAIYFGEDGIVETTPSGALFLDMSSIQPAVARDHAARIEDAGRRHLDAPVSGGEAGAKAASLAIMVGGRAVDYSEAEPVLNAMGVATHVGVHGAGQVAKLANQAIVGVTIGGVAEALMLAKEGGCDPRAVREALMGGFATSRILELHGQRMIDHDYVPGGTVANQLKDLDNALEVAREAELDLPLTRQVRAAFSELAHDMSMGNYDHSAYRLWLAVLNNGKQPEEGGYAGGSR